MINAIPLLGWFLSLFFSISLAIPFWFLWTVLGIGEKYFYWLPVIYYNIGFWNVVGIFIVVSIIKSVLFPSFSVSNTNKNN